MPARALLVIFALYVLLFYVAKAFGILGDVPPLFPVGLSRVWQETAQVLPCGGC
jgi:hypothetical protein